MLLYMCTAVYNKVAKAVQGNVCCVGALSEGKNRFVKKMVFQAIFPQMLSLDI